MKHWCKCIMSGVRRSGLAVSVMFSLCVNIGGNVSLVFAGVDGEMHIEQAVQALEENDILRAMQEYQVAVGDPAVTAEAYRGLLTTRLQYVDALIRENRFEAAGGQLRKARSEAIHVEDLADEVADKTVVIAEQYTGSNKYDHAIRYFKKAVDMRPGEIRVRDRLTEVCEQAAQSAFNMRKYKTAQKYAREGLRYDDQETRLHDILGDTYRMQQNFSRARTSWQTAQQIIAANGGDASYIDQKLSDLAEEKSRRAHRKVRDTAKFSIVVDDDAHRTGVDKIKKQLRKAYSDISRDFKYYPTNKIPVEIYSQGDFAEAIGPWHVFIAGQYDGSVRVPASYNVSHPKFFKALLYHEVTHAFVHDMSAGNTPRWFNEGLAQVQGKKHFTHQLTALRVAVKAGNTLSMQDLLAWDGGSGGSLRLHYEQSYSMVKYLIEQYRWPRIQKLMRDLRAGVDFADAFKGQYRIDVHQFENKWRTYIRRKYR